MRMNKRRTFKDRDALIYVAVAGGGCVLAGLAGQLLPQPFRSPLFVLAIGLAIAAIRVLQPSNTFVPRVSWLGLGGAMLFVGGSVVLAENPQLIGAEQNEVLVSLSLVGGLVLLLSLARRGRSSQGTQEHSDERAD